MESIQLMRYDNLPHNHFRLAQILPGRHDDDLVISLDSFAIDTVVSYSALSYCWGDSWSDIRYEMCYSDNGTIKNCIRITTNLAKALRYLRREEEQITMWADQICINQDSKDDKSQQIRLMGWIYGNARVVVIWLGDQDETTVTAYKLIDDIVTQLAVMMRNGKEWIADPSERGRSFWPLTLSGADTAEWLAFRKLFERPWFSRVWTFEEAVLAKQALLCCGSLYTTWQKLAMVSQSVRAWDKHQPGHLSHSQGVDDSFFRMAACNMARVFLPARDIQATFATPYVEFDNLLRTLSGRATSKPHDKVYGALAIATGIDVETYPIDYNAHFREVYAYATKRAIMQHQDLTILRLKRITPGKRPQTGPNILPNWLPDYRFDDTETQNRWFEQGPRTFLHGKERQYNATGSTLATLPDLGGISLPLRGLKVDVISQLSETEKHLTFPTSVDDIVLEGGQWFELASRSIGSAGIYQLTAETIELAYARTCVRDYLPGETRSEDRMNRSESPRWVANTQPSSIVETQMGERLLFSQLGDVMPSRIIAATSNQRLFVTVQGYIGLCHLSCQPGDEVWLVMGSDSPYILRRLDTGGYHFKGEAYVHGIMDGEYLVARYCPAALDLRHHVQVKGSDTEVMHTRNSCIHHDMYTNLAYREWLYALSVDLPFMTTDIVLT